MPRPGDLRVIVGDVHGDARLLRALLERIGVVDASGARQPGFWVLQLGDLVHLGHEVRAGDLAVVRGAVDLGWFDHVLLGNHELFHVLGREEGRFQGMHPLLSDPVTHALRTLLGRGHFLAAASVDGWLCSHAGVHRQYAALPADARKAATAINARMRRWLDGAHDPLFSAVGPVRGFEQRPGGIFWADLVEQAPHADALPWPQIVGHTPQRLGEEARAVTDRLWVVDAGAGVSGRLAAITKTADDETWTPHVVHPPGEPTAR